MKILVIGSGGREHALVWLLSQEAEVHVAPGNPGMADQATLHAIDSMDQDGISELCKQLRPDLVIVGPEAPLLAGLSDRLNDEGILCLGPCAKGANLEGSKSWSKELMTRAGVPTARYEVFTNAVAAKDYANRRFDRDKKVVVKASGAALGKGAIVCPTLEEAYEAIDMMLTRRELGVAGSQIVVEDCLPGEEFSLLTVCTESGYRSLPVVQDYKRIGVGDTGPNTGGMGSYSPLQWVDGEIVARTEELVVAPILRDLRNHGVNYRGILFSGIMMGHDGPMCLEYNVRLGDPETQTMVRRVKGFANILIAAAKAEPLPPVQMNPDPAITVVMANDGYPGAYQKTGIIHIPKDLPEGVVVFHAGTQLIDGNLIATGGRVLSVSASGPDLATARARAYAACEQISWEKHYYRQDIGLLRP